VKTGRSTFLLRHGAAAAAAAMLVSGLLLSFPLGARAVLAQHIAIPSYFDVSLPGGPALYQRLAQNVPMVDIAVINGPYSRAPVPFDQRTANAIKVMQLNGVKVLGYVDTGYFGFSFFGNPGHQTRGGSTASSAWTTQIEGDIDDWHNLYRSWGLDGIFLDESIRTCGPSNMYVDLYNTITDYIFRAVPSDYTVINPGAAAEACYQYVADTIIMFEGDYTHYITTGTDPDGLYYTVPTWTPASPNKFWHLLYNTTAVADMQNAVSLSQSRGAGYVYVTDANLPNPWNRLPSTDAYWNGELVKASGIVDTIPPTPPGAPQATSVITSTTGVARALLTWGSATDNVAVVGYDVYQGSTLIQSVYGATAQVSGLAASTVYTFSVKARDPSGNISDFSPSLTLTTPPPASAPIINASACLDPSIAKYGATYANPFDFSRVFIDSDNNAATGFPVSGIGADYLIENANFYQYAGPRPTWNWTRVTAVSPLVSSDNGIYSWQIPASALGAGRSTTQKVVFNGGYNGGSPPDYYASTIAVTQVSLCA
jgi:hypothetical protein